MRPHNRSRILAFFLVFLLLLGNVPTSAQTTEHKGIGVIQVQGFVSLNTIPAVTGTTIFRGDVVRTGADGSALVSLPDRGSLVIAADSELIFPLASLGSHFVALHRGKVALRILPQASDTTAEFGKLVLIPVIGQGVEFDVEIAADGSALVHCLDGSVGIIEIQGPNSTFLKSGESAKISVDGVVERIPPSVSLSSNSAASTTPTPSSTAPGGKSRAGWILLGVGGGGVAALVAILVSQHKTTPVSPSTP